MVKWLRSVLSSYFFIISVALVLGLVFSVPAAQYLSPYTTYFLGAILFFSGLHIDIKAVFAELRRPLVVAVVSALVIGVIPVAVFYGAQWLVPELAIAFLILTSMPAGMTAPFLTELAGGKQSLALVVTVVTSLVAPLSVPLLIAWLAGQTVEVPYVDMMQSLALVIFIPFIAAQIIRAVAGIKRLGKQASSVLSAISLLLLGMLVAGIIAGESERFLNGFSSGESVMYVLWLFGLFIIFHIVGYIVSWWRPHQERIAVMVTLSYMNFTLAVYLVDEYFAEPEIVLPVVLSVIPWALFFAPFKAVMQYLRKR